MRGNEQRPAQSWLQLVCFDHPGLLGINHYPRKVSFGRLGTWSALLYRKSKRPWSMPAMMGGVIPIFWRQQGPGSCLYRHSQRSSKKSSSWQNQCRFPHTAFSVLTSFSFLWLLRLCTELSRPRSTKNVGDPTKNTRWMEESDENKGAYWSNHAWQDFPFSFKVYTRRILEHAHPTATCWSWGLQLQTVWLGLGPNWRCKEEIGRLQVLGLVPQ